MIFSRLKDSFYHSMYKELIYFSQTDNNQDIYALVFDCDSENGQICLRYGSEPHFAKISKKYNICQEKQQYKLHRFKYSVGDYAFIGSIQHNGYVCLAFDSDTEHFLESYYYHCIWQYFGQGSPITNLDSGEILNKETVKTLFYEMILECICRLKENLSFLHTTEDFIFYMCDHQNSIKDNEKLMKKTVDLPLFTKLNLKQQ